MEGKKVLRLELAAKPIDKLRVTIMGLGLHGGGLASALFFARHRAKLTVTDLRDKQALQSSLAELKAYPVRYVLGRHEEKDFVEADLIIKNPGVALDSPFLKIAREHTVPIETDISVFLKLCANPIIAVTGSKGKSTTASAIHFCLSRQSAAARLGGNITVSPLKFLEELEPDAPVVLELSSWQLADLGGRELLKPRISIITNILPDHMNWYPGLAEYIADKKIIYENQDKSDYAIFNYDDVYSKDFAGETRAATLFFSQAALPPGLSGGWLEGEKGYVRINNRTLQVLAEKVALPGVHNRLNLLSVGIALCVFGIESGDVLTSLARFPGIEHRLEKFFTRNGVSYYNDSASTIPHSVVAALQSLQKPVILITGGTDKNIDFSPLGDVLSVPEKIILLDGSATGKIIALCREFNLDFFGPFPALEDAVKCAYENARPGTSVLFSPGCASFGMFLNEFDRGQKFKRIVESI
jgi:UDP-N-acetylmuramoylalanine--D-glutamate ligase